ncbi:MAG: hypothetical protein ACREBG_31250 [Pyrinomonadaceae bacterium]
MRLARVTACKPYAHLKHNTRLLRNRSYWTTGAHHPGKFPEELDDLRVAASKERLQSVLAAGVPHVFSYEALATLRTAPEWSEFFRHAKGPSEGALHKPGRNSFYHS